MLGLDIGESLPNISYNLQDEHISSKNPLLSDHLLPPRIQSLFEQRFSFLMALEIAESSLVNLKNLYLSIFGLTQVDVQLPPH